MPKALPMVDISAPICCAPVSAAPLDDDTALEIALRLKALADPVRIKLVSILLTDTGEGICTCDLATAVSLTEATTSHHLGQLRKAGMVAPDRRGMNVALNVSTTVPGQSRWKRCAAFSAPSRGAAEPSQARSVEHLRQAPLIGNRATQRKAHSGAWRKPNEEVSPPRPLTLSPMA